MKKIILLFSVAAMLICCEQKVNEHKVTTTDTSSKIVVAALAAADSFNRADSTKKLIAALATDTIYAGEGIAELAIDNSLDEAIKIMGEPSTTDTSKTTTLLQWKIGMTDTVQYYTNALFNTSGDLKKIKQINTNSPTFKTPMQVSCGSTLAYIKIQYPTLKKPTETYLDKEEKTIAVYDEVKEGIAFEINESGKCVLVSVHVKGQKNIKLPL
ncbi:MAG: hypothetical protein ACKVOM_10225 [Ferruginibacter sp.]